MTNDSSFTRRQINGVIIGALAAPFISGCSGEDAPKEVVRLRQEWFPFCGYAGEVVAAKNYAPQQKLQLSIESGGESIDPVKTVLSEQDQIGVVGADILVSSIAEGAPIVAIGVVNEVSPTCFVSSKASAVRTLADFVGKRVGILQGTNTQKIYELLMQRNKIDRSKITEKDVPFELQTFILGEYDIRPAFVYDEPVSLSRSRFEYDVLLPQDYGVDFLGTVYFTSKKNLRERRPSLVKTLASLVRGWQSIATPEGRIQGIKAVKDLFNDIDESRELESLNQGFRYFLGPKDSGLPLTVTDGRWEAMIRSLEELKAVKPNTVTLSDVWNPSLLEEGYSSIEKKK